MKLLHSTPKADGFSMPGEFEPHQGCIMIWPDRADSWQYGGYGARAAFTEVATAISRWEPVTMLVNDAQYETARTMLPDAVRVVECSTDDAWARDIAPTFVRRADGTVRGVDWQFNAWGGLVDGLYFHGKKTTMQPESAVICSRWIAMMHGISFWRAAASTAMGKAPF